MTLEERLNKAFTQLRRQGIVVKRNVASCCQSCANLDLANEVPVLWSFAGQGNRNVVSGNDYDYSEWGFNHGNLATDEGLTDSGKRVLEALESNGIAVEWENEEPQKRSYRKLYLNLERSVA